MPKARKPKQKQKPRFTGKDSFHREQFKPRHSVRLICDFCGWAFRGGGYTTVKERDQAEKEQKTIHDRNHKAAKGVKSHQIKIERDSHAVEIAHAYVEVSPTTAQTTTSTSYVDVTNAVIASTSFAAGVDHLVIATAMLNNPTSNDVASIRMVRGTTPTQIDDSEYCVENPSTSVTAARTCYNWWGIVNANPAEQVKMQFKMNTTATAATIDLITITVIRLGSDLTLNTDYKYDLNLTSTTLSSFDTDTTTNNASVTITPPVNNHKWLILSKARYAGGMDPAVAVQSRIERSGTSTSSIPIMQNEGEDGVNDKYILMGMRTDTLAASSHTYTEISLKTATTTGTTSPIRTHSGVFMMDLDSFKNAVVNQDDSGQLLFNSTTAYAQQLRSQAITPTQIGDVLFLSHLTFESGGSGATCKLRQQVDNTDAPPDHTTRSYDLIQWDAADRIPIVFNHIGNYSAAAHTLDIDGSWDGVAATSQGTVNRTIAIFTMEMSSAAVTQSKAESVGITEQVIRVKSSQITKLTAESVGITEGVIKLLGSASASLNSSHFQLRLSGGTTNTSPAASIGGAMSTDITEPNTGIIASTLLDDVSSTEATSGDPTPDHRCFYVLNTHSTMTMQGLKIWLSSNTQGDDFVELGLGNSAIGSATTETAIANEGTAPSPTVTFSQAASLASALTIGDLPAGQHKAIWIRRTVPAGTNKPVTANSYSISAQFATN